MKVSEITIENIVDYLRLDTYTEQELLPLLTVAKSFISSYTGIPITSSDPSVKTLDNYEDFYIVVMILCQDMYDNRSLYVDKSSLNKVVKDILGMYRTNFLPTVEVTA